MTAGAGQGERIAAAPADVGAEPFGARLAARVQARRSQVVLGLDPDPARLWPEALESAPAGGSPRERAAAAVAAHCAALISAAGPAASRTAGPAPSTSRGSSTGSEAGGSRSPTSAR